MKTSTTMGIIGLIGNSILLSNAINHGSIGRAMLQIVGIICGTMAIINDQ